MATRTISLFRSSRPNNNNQSIVSNTGQANNPAYAGDDGGADGGGLKVTLTDEQVRKYLPFLKRDFYTKKVLIVMGVCFLIFVIGLSAGVTEQQKAAARGPQPPTFAPTVEGGDGGGGKKTKKRRLENKEQRKAPPSNFRPE